MVEADDRTIAFTLLILILLFIGDIDILFSIKCCQVLGDIWPMC